MVTGGSGANGLIWKRKRNHILRRYDSNSTDKLEVDNALILPLFLHHTSFKGYLKLVKATQEGEKLDQGCDVTGDLAH